MTPPTESSPALGSPAALAASQAAFGGPSSRTPAAEPFQIVIRGMKQPTDTGTTVEGSTPVEALKAALAVADFPTAEPVIQWRGTERLCCLDVDYHAIADVDDRPSVEWLNAKAAIVQPRPFAYHVSHGRGIKLFYAEQSGFAADELAVVAALGWMEMDGRATCDLVRISRHPSYARPGYPECGAVHWQTPGADMSGVARMFADRREFDEEAVEEYLEGRGWRRGERLDHRECLIEPNDTAHGRPVILGDDGVYCHRCAGKGVTHHSCRKPGFVPYSALVGEVTAPSVVKPMVRNFTHWQHALPVLRHALRLPDAFTRRMYTAAMKAYHLSDAGASPEKREAVGKKIVKVFCGPPIVRSHGAWVDADGSGRFVAEKSLTSYVPQLGPASWVDENGKLAPSPIAVGRLFDGGDLTDIGYPAHRPIPSFDAWEQIGDPDVAGADGVPVLKPANPPVRYVRADDRGAGHWDHLDRQFPGIDKALVKLVVGAIAYAQKPGTGEGPKLLVVGQSRGGKTHGVKVAAELAGVATGEATLSDDGDKFIRACVAGAGRGVVLVDEAAKTSTAPKACTAAVLSYRKGKDFHKLHSGTATVGHVAPLVFVDVVRPAWITEDRQTARRVVVHDVGAGATCSADWRKTSGGGFEGWRARAPENAACADAVVSEVLDEVRELGRDSTFEQYAASLGVSTAEGDGADGVDTSEPFRELFIEAMRAPDTQNKAYRGRGWKVFEPNDPTPLAAAWRACGDAAGHVDDQLIAGRQWAKELGIPGLRVEMNMRGRKIGLRWAIGTNRSPSAKYGRDVIPDGHPLLSQVNPPSDGVAPFPIVPTPQSGQVGTGSGQGSGQSESVIGA